MTFQRIQQNFHRGNLLEAYNEADRARQLHSATNADWSWRFRLLEAQILAFQGSYREVLTLLQSDPPPSLSSTDLRVRQWMLQGLALARLGELQKSEENLQRAFQLCAQLQCPSKGDLLGTKGVVEIERNNLDEAESAFRESLAAARQVEDRFLEASALLNLGVVAELHEHFDQAIDLLQAAYSAAEKIGAEQTKNKALGSIGWEALQLGDLERALTLSLQADKRASEIHDRRAREAWLSNAGLAYYRMGDPSHAERSYQQALALAQEAGNTPDTLVTLSLLAVVSFQSGRYRLAQEYSAQALQLARKSGERIDQLEPLLVLGLLAAHDGNIPSAESIFHEVANDPQSDGALRSRAMNALAKLQLASRQPALADQWFRKAIFTLEAQRSSLRDESRLPFFTNAAELYDDYIQFLVDQGKTSEALRWADFGRARTLAEGLHLLPEHSSINSIPRVDIQGIARRLHSTLLFYWLGSNRSLLWVATPSKTVLFRLPPASEIRSLVEDYRKALLSPRDPLRSGNESGTKLYDMLVAPAQALIPRGSRVTVVPDDILNTLNFETLQVLHSGPHYWIDDVSVSTASSLMLLAAYKPHGAGAKSLLLLGDPVPADAEHPELPSAQTEIQQIRQHFPSPQVRILAKNEATPAAYIAGHPERYDLIHFVAHGTASRLSPLDSAVILSSTNGDPDSYKLYAREIIRHPLKAELVTISTCYGAGSRAYAGEGLVGLSWAFLRAGAHHVVGALWEVSDASTPQLMDRFYNELARGASPNAALHNAKLALLHSDGVFRKPFYWAPFQLYVGP